MKSSSIITAHIALAILVIIITGLIYTSVQQAHRTGGNDPQMQIARAIAQRLSENKTADYLIVSDSLDLLESEAVFATYYDDAGKPVYSSAMLNGNLPQIPKGVLEHVKNNAEDVLTWQPQQGVRMAMVVEKVTGASVAAVAVGRSLRQVELRVSNLTKMVLMAFSSAIVILFIHCMFQLYLFKKK